MKFFKNSGQRGRGVYLLPNLFTTASLFAAFYAIIATTKGQMDQAAIAIFIAMIADAVDGRVARLIGAQSAFGAEYDSLSDMVAFGVAPALLAYSWALSSLGKFGWLTAFLFTAAVALRLARFNTQLTVADKRYFQGLASPPAAAVVVSFVWFAYEQELSGWAMDILLAIIVICVSLLMVSNIRYYSFKDLDFRKSLPSVVGILVVLTFVAVSLYPPLTLFIGFTLYAVSGVVITLLHIRRGRKMRKHQSNEEKSSIKKD